MQALFLNQTAAVFSSPRATYPRLMVDIRSVAPTTKVEFRAEDLSFAQLEESEVSAAMRQSEFSRGDVVQWFEDVRAQAALALEDM